MQRRLPGVLVAVLGLLASAIPASAHHSFAAEFDANKCTDLTGTFTSFEWQNPHGYFHLDVKDPGGSVTSWTFETVSLSTLKRSGTQRKDFSDNVGKTVTVRAVVAVSISIVNPAAVTQTNRNSFVLSSLIASRNLAAFSNSKRLAVSRISLSSLAM